MCSRGGTCPGPVSAVVVAKSGGREERGVSEGGATHTPWGCCHRKLFRAQGEDAPRGPAVPSDRVPAPRSRPSGQCRAPATARPWSWCWRSGAARASPADTDAVRRGRSWGGWPWWAKRGRCNAGRWEQLKCISRPDWLSAWHDAANT